jgi:hypothetical protein
MQRMRALKFNQRNSKCERAAAGQGSPSKYISLAGMLWPSVQCGQATEILMSRILANIAGSVTMAVFTVREVFGHLYVSALI